MIEIALKIINKAFCDKIDKAGQPYVNHLKRVSESCPKIGVFDEVKTIALLHDLLEDCPEWNEKALRTFFTDGVVDSVVALTHKQGQTYHQYISQVMDDGWAVIVKKHDLEDNMNITRLNDVTNEDWERLKKYHKAYIRITESQQGSKSFHQ